MYLQQINSKNVLITIIINKVILEQDNFFYKIKYDTSLGNWKQIFGQSKVTYLIWNTKILKKKSLDIFGKLSNLNLTNKIESRTNYQVKHFI